MADYAELSHILGLPPEASRPRVGGIAFDSRKVKPGDVFFALSGSRTDGARFVVDAANAGASVVIGEGPRPPGLKASVIYAQSPDARQALARAAAWFHPRQPGVILAVTGTAGKSSVADFARQIFQALGHESASLGTLGVISQKRAEYGSLTTPDPVALHATLDQLAGEGVTHLAVEASSHGLDQRRLDGLKLTAGAFTNLGRDHLDYHADVEDYLRAKLRLFDTLLPSGAPTIINMDGDRSRDVRIACEARGLKVFTTGRSGEHLKALSIAPAPFGQRLELAFSRHAYVADLPLIGVFQVENALVAAGFALALGESPKRTFEALSALKGVSGRLEHIGARGTAPVFIDYAHKPEALAHVLDAVRPSVTGRLIVAFGCGGDRDRGKRPIMGAIAAQKADVVIVTDDNPRSEAPAAIRREILVATPGALEIGDRAEAIRHAVDMLKDGDALIIAGKGHETGQIIAGVTSPFSDHDEARAALRAVGGSLS